MADQYKMGSIYPIEPNPLLDATSRGLSALRKFLNQGYRTDLPPEKRGELGSLLLGRSPEEINRWAYGFHPFNDPKDWARTGPIQEQRQSDVADVGMVPFRDIAAPAAVAARGIGTLARGAMEGATDIGRRAFLRDTGLGVAGAAVAAPMIMKGIGRMAEHEAPRVAAEEPVKAVRERTLDEVREALEKAHARAEEAAEWAVKGHPVSFPSSGPMSKTDPAVRKQLMDNFLSRHGKGKFLDHAGHVLENKAPEEMLPGRYAGLSINNKDLVYMDSLESELNVLRMTPGFEDWKEFIKPGGHDEILAQQEQSDLLGKLLRGDTDSAAKQIRQGVTPLSLDKSKKRGGMIERTTRTRKIL